MAAVVVFGMRRGVGATGGMEKMEDEEAGWAAAPPCGWRVETREEDGGPMADMPTGNGTEGEAGKESAESVGEGAV